MGSANTLRVPSDRLNCHLKKGIDCPDTTFAERARHARRGRRDLSHSRIFVNQPEPFIHIQKSQMIQFDYQIYFLANHI